MAGADRGSGYFRLRTAWPLPPPSQHPVAAAALSRSAPGRVTGLAGGLELGAPLPARPVTAVGQFQAEVVDQQRVSGQPARIPLRAPCITGLVVAAGEIGVAQRTSGGDTAVQLVQSGTKGDRRHTLA